jgi:hypothetical protein
MRHVTLQILAFILTTGVGFAATEGDPDKDPEMMKLLEYARHLIGGKNPAAAIPKCDAVINAYTRYYGARKEKIYCARSGPESFSGVSGRLYGKGRMVFTRKNSLVAAASVALRVVVVPESGAKMPRPLSDQLVNGTVRSVL